MMKLLKLMEAIDSPESAAEFVSEILETYKPVVYNIIDQFFTVYKDLTGNDEFFAERAKYKRQLLDAYMAAGFTREEALLFLLDNETRKERALGMLKQAQVNVPVNKGM